MKYLNVFRLNNAMALLNLQGASATLAIKVMQNKIAIEEAVEMVQKQLKALKEGFKPSDYETLKTELEQQKKVVKEKLSEEVIDKEKLEIANMRLSVLQNEWDTRYKEVEDELLSKSANIKLVKFTQEELVVLMKPREELRQLSNGETKMMVTNHFYADSLAALAPLFKESAS